MASVAVDQLRDTDTEEFFDCSDDGGCFGECFTTTARKDSWKETDDRRGSHTSTEQDLMRRCSNGGCSVGSTRQTSGWRGRTRLPATMVSRNDFSLWGFLKQCIGRELSKITMPISFNEPLSFLQRLVEYMEYAQSLLERASASLDPVERMELVTAFAVSATASNWERTGKPFNPLLGETYELNSEELGFRIVCEQVEHHPPISAFHVESPNYTFHGNIHPKVRFWGTSIQVTPKGRVTLHLLKHNEVYSWQNINCSVHNIVIGKVWVEHYGDMEVTNHRNKYKAALQFKPCGWTGADLHKVNGYLYDENKKKIRCFYGKWIEALYSCDVKGWEMFARSSWKDLDSQTKQKTDSVSDPVPVPVVGGASCNLFIPGQKLLWAATPKPDDANRYYNFTLFATMLNDVDARLAAEMAPTDSRLRPDMRLMETADVEGASAEKFRLEDKQRDARKERRRLKGDWQPSWFRLRKNVYTGDEEWQFTGEYWARDWRRCPDIF